jgi:hypothetical protein
LFNVASSFKQFFSFEVWSIIFFTHKKNTFETSLMHFPSIIPISLQEITKHIAMPHAPMCTVKCFFCQSDGGVLLLKSITKFENYLIGKVCEHYHPILPIVVSIRWVSEPFLDALHHKAFSYQITMCVCAIFAM